MKLCDVWEDFCFWCERNRPVLQLAVWIVGGAMIVVLEAQEFCKKRICK